MSVERPIRVLSLPIRVLSLAVVRLKASGCCAQVDWFLWEEGERKAIEGELPPHHRTRTTFY